MAKEADQLPTAFHDFIEIIARSLTEHIQADMESTEKTAHDATNNFQFCYRVSTLVTVSYHPQPPATEAFPNENEDNTCIILFPM